MLPGPYPVILLPAVGGAWPDRSKRALRGDWGGQSPRKARFDLGARVEVGAEVELD
jgi:hypothetical protein